MNKNSKISKKREALEKKVEVIELTLKDVIDFIADGYKIESKEFISNPHSLEKMYGVHLEEGSKKSILIDSELVLDIKQSVIIHELYHALYRRLNKHQNESEIDYLTQKTYDKLYPDKKGNGK